MGLEEPRLRQDKREKLYRAQCLPQGVPADPQRGLGVLPCCGLATLQLEPEDLSQQETRTILTGSGEELRFFIITLDEAVPKTFQDCRAIPLVVICKSQFQSNFLLLAPENTQTHTAYSRDKASDHQVEEVGHREERAQVDDDRSDDQSVNCQLRI